MYSFLFDSEHQSYPWIFKGTFQSHILMPHLCFGVRGAGWYLCLWISVCMCCYLTCRNYPSKSTVLGFPVCDPSVSRQFSQLPGEQKPERGSMYGNHIFIPETITHTWEAEHMNHLGSDWRGRQSNALDL